MTVATVVGRDAPGPAASLDDWLSYLEAQHPKGQAGIELGLERVQLVKVALGQNAHCPIITVAGTNGKGSTVAYLESILSRAGYRVGAYSSPHLYAYNERVRLDRQPADDAALVSAFERVEIARREAGNVHLTYFEFGTLAAWEAFVAAKTDIAILEVGLGGRLDAVNAYDADLALLTTVDLDHMDWLGETREAIGREKAGIFRPGRLALCADPNPPASVVAHATDIGADLRLIGRDFGYARDPQNRLQWQWWARNGEQLVRRSLAFPGLRGQAQLANAALVLAALEYWRERLPLSMQAIRQGLIETELPGRCQVLPGRPAIVLDVAHNPQAVRMLVDSLGDMGFFDRTYAVVGMLADKDIDASLAPLKSRIDAWFCATLEGPRGMAGERLVDAIEHLALGGEASAYASPAAALRAAEGRAGESDRILIFGSFHTVAGVRNTLKDGRK